MPQQLINNAISNIPLHVTGARANPSTPSVVANPVTAAAVSMAAGGTSVDVTPTPVGSTETFTLEFADPANKLKGSLECVFTPEIKPEEEEETGKKAAAEADVNFVIASISTRPIGV